MNSHYFQKLILNWFDQHGRKHLPWTQSKTPYRVWISEIMLQQTQVNTVLPYFEKFMQHFPDLKSLANAPQDQVLHLWSGLGYYSRARNLHKTATIIMNEFNGQFPPHSSDLQNLPGIGRSTAAAISSLAFNQAAAILDGNVKRVLTRVYGITEAINEKKIENKLWMLAERLMPHHRCADYTQAMMDLGATICLRAKPQCTLCPLAKDCIAYQQNMTEFLPKKKSTKVLPSLTSTFFILQKDRQILLHKRPPNGIWGGLWSFPEMPDAPTGENIKIYCDQHFHLTLSTCKKLPTFKHTFSHFHLDIFPVLIPIKRMPVKMMEADSQIWYNLDKPPQIGLPKPIQSILRELHNDSIHTVYEVT